MFAIAALLSLILLNALYVMREKHRRRVAQAKLEIVETVTEMERLMREGKIRLGDVCHDKFHEKMLAFQYADKFSVDWTIFVPFYTRHSKERNEINERIHKEITDGTELGQIIKRHLMATFKAFNNQRPILALMFLSWVMIRQGGILVMISGLFALLIACIMTHNFLVGFRKFRREVKINVAAWYAAVRVAGPVNFAR